MFGDGRRAVIVWGIVLLLGVSSGAAWATPGDGPGAAVTSGAPEQEKPTDERLLARARKALKKKEFEEAFALLRRVAPDSPLREQADLLSDEVQQVEFEAIQAGEADRVRKMFRKMKAKKEVTQGDVTTTRPKVRKADAWVFDRRSGKKSSLRPGKGQSYIVADYYVKSTSTDPVLPPVAAYYVEEGRAWLLGGFVTAFHGWADSQSYEGAVKSPENDFTGDGPVRLTSGLAVDRSRLGKSAILVVLSGTPCLQRRMRTGAAPHLYYKAIGCALPEVANPDEFLEQFEVIGVVNRGKL